LAHGHLLLLQLTQLLLSLLLLSLLLLVLCVCPRCSATTLPGNTAGSVTVTCVRLDGKSFTAVNATDPSTYKLEVCALCWQKFGKTMKPLLWELQTHMQQTTTLCCVILSQQDAAAAAIKCQAPSSHCGLLMVSLTLTVCLRILKTHPMQRKHCHSQDCAIIAALMNAVGMLCLRLNHGCCPGISKLHMCRPAYDVGCNRLSRYCSHRLSFTGTDCGQQAASTQMRQ
jgi:hypothetical protein